VPLPFCLSRHRSRFSSLPAIRASLRSLAATAVPAVAFAPGMGSSNAITYSQRSAQASCLAHKGKGALSLRASGDRFERPDLNKDNKINLGTTQTSWQVCQYSV
jgi:hypothetical protein